MHFVNFSFIFHCLILKEVQNFGFLWKQALLTYSFASQVNTSCFMEVQTFYWYKRQRYLLRIRFFRSVVLVIKINRLYPY